MGSGPSDKRRQKQRTQDRQHADVLRVSRFEPQPIQVKEDCRQRDKRQDFVLGQPADEGGTEQGGQQPNSKRLEPRHIVGDGQS